MSRLAGKVAVVPIFVLWFGAGAVPAVLTAMIMSIFPIVVNIATGLATTEPELEDVMRSLRATSLGKATIGQEFSTSSKCWRDRYARTTCGPTSVDERSTWTPSQQLFHSGSVRKHPRTSV